MKGILGSLQSGFDVQNGMVDKDGDETFVLINNTGSYAKDKDGKVIIGKYNLIKKVDFYKMFPEFKDK